MPCGLSATDRDEVRDASDRFSSDIIMSLDQRKSQVFTPEVLRKVNARWEQLVEDLKAAAVHDENWSVYTVGHDIMMAAYYSVTEDLGQSMGSADSYSLMGPLERIWVPVVLKICAVSEEQRRRFQDEYAASVT